MERWIASVAPVAANAASVSLSGIADARPGVRRQHHRLRDLRQGQLLPSAAAAAANAGTPGVTV